MTRRTAIAVAAGGVAFAAGPPDLAGKIGITTGSFNKLLSPTPAKGKLVMLDLPRIMRDELDLEVLDLMTATLPSLDLRYCEQLRAAAAKSRVTIANLKMNQPEIDMASADETARSRAVAEYKKTIDSAAALGCRWVRPLPGRTKPDLAILARSYHELMDYAAPKRISLLAENYGWMQDDPDALPAVVSAVGRGLKVQPDTGNWTPQARYEGLGKAFPHAVSCDFKAFRLGADGSHADYDLKRCFDVAWRSGFRGPWCFEHFHDELRPLLHEMTVLRDMIRAWSRAAG